LLTSSPRTISGSQSDDEAGSESRVVLDALGGRYSVEIVAAADTPVSAQELSDRMDIPIATCYRRIEELVDAGLLRREGRELSDQGRRTNVYRRTVDELAVDFTDRPVTPRVRERGDAERPVYGDDD
jgi:predicted transcriptional regulator